MKYPDPLPEGVIVWRVKEFDDVMKRGLDPFDPAVQAKVLERRTRDALAKAWG